MQFSRTDLRMWLRWFVANTAGLVLGLLIAGGITSAGYENYKLLSAALGGATFGVCLAAVQILSVSQHIKAGRWILASLVGYSLGYIFMQMINNWLHFDVWAAEQGRSLVFFGVFSGVVSLAIGLPVGIMQWWSFRQGGVSLAVWILTSLLAIGGSTFVALLVAWKVNTDQTVSGLEIPTVLLSMSGIFSMVSWLPVSRSIKPHTLQGELTAKLTVGLEDSSSIDE